MRLTGVAVQPTSHAKVSLDSLQTSSDAIQVLLSADVLGGDVASEILIQAYVVAIVHVKSRAQ